MPPTTAGRWPSPCRMTGKDLAPWHSGAFLLFLGGRGRGGLSSMNPHGECAVGWVSQPGATALSAADIWEYLETVLVVTGEAFDPLLWGAQGCCNRAQHSPTKNSPSPRPGMRGGRPLQLSSFGKGTTWPNHTHSGSDRLCLL